MSFYAKSVVATFFLAVGLVAVICMLTLMGRSERKISATFLRRMHKSAGFVFTVLLLVISYFCIKYVAMMGDQLSARAIFHAVLALALFIVLALKLSIVQFYKQFLRYVPGLGMTVFALAFVVFCTSSGYFFLKTENRKAKSEEISKPTKTVLEGDVEKGAALFDSKCSFCHYADKETTKFGPGLKGVLKRQKLPYSGRPANLENIKKQLRNPISAMPSFASFSEQEIADLLVYLETL